MGENSDELFNQEGQPSSGDAALDVTEKSNADVYQEPLPYDFDADSTGVSQAAPSQQSEQQPEQTYAPPRPSRESILQSYALQDAQRAYNVRSYSDMIARQYQEHSAWANERAQERAKLDEQMRRQEAMRAEKRASEAAYNREREARARQNASRVVTPLSSQESHDRARSSMEYYERERAMRDVLSIDRQLRTSNREIIDGRGSIDSRAFNETHELVGYSVDERDRPQIDVDTSLTHSDAHWDSRDTTGSDGSRRAREPSVGSVRLTSSMMGGSASKAGVHQGYFSSMPLAIKIGIPVIVVLVIVLIVLLVR